MKEVNDEIRQYQQEIKIANDEVTNDEVVVFMSVGYDDATKSQNVFSPTELEFFRTLIEQILTTESRQITGIHAINLVGNMKSSFTKTDAQVSRHCYLSDLYSLSVYLSHKLLVPMKKF